MVSTSERDARSASTEVAKHDFKTVASLLETIMALELAKHDCKIVIPRNNAGGSV